LLSVPQRDLLVNFERMWREIDELVGSSDPWRRARRQGGFSPRVDVYYCGDASNEPKAIAKVELPGVDVDSVNLEVVGRELVISGERPVQETEGRVYQQVEIQTGPFRRIVPLGTDVVAEEARASYEDGVLRVELPLRREDVTHTVPIEPRDE
jgi:HSP20 family protein